MNSSAFFHIFLSANLNPVSSIWSSPIRKVNQKANLEALLWEKTTNLLHTKLPNATIKKNLQDYNISSSSSLQVNTLAHDKIPWTVWYCLLLMELEIPIRVLQPSHPFQPTYLKVKEIKDTQKIRFVNYMVTLRNRNSATSDSHNTPDEEWFLLIQPQDNSLDLMCKASPISLYYISCSYQRS